MARARASSVIPLRSELPDADVPENPTIALVRASSRTLKELAHRKQHQDDSPETQVAQIEDYCRRVGYTLPHKWFIERESGRSFDKRDVYQEMFEWVQRNERTDKATLVCVEVDRFTREINPKTGKPHIGKIMAQFEAFNEKGWHVDFALTPVKRDAEFTDYLVLIVKAFMAGEYSRVLGVRIREAKGKTANAGRHIGGVVPFPAMRADALTKRPLKFGEWSPNGSLLVRDPELYPTWEYAAKRVVDGASCGQVAEELVKMRAKIGPYMRAHGSVQWTHHAVRRMLTNTSLISEPVYDVAVLGGGAQARKAAWEPVVPVALFLAANAKLNPPEGRVRIVRQAIEEPFLLTPVCQACGGPYYPHEWGDRRYPDKRKARYIHVNTTVRSANKWQGVLERARECGCRAWSFDRDPAEAAVRELIARQRTSPDFIDHMLRFRRAAGHRLDEAQTFAKGREDAYKAAERDLAQFIANIGSITNPKVLARLEATLTEMEASVEAARKAWRLAEAKVGEVSEDAGDLREKIDFTAQVLRTWEQASPEDQRTVIDWWVDLVQVVPGKKQGNRSKKDECVLLVHLRTNPEQPKAIRLVEAIEGQERRKGNSLPRNNETSCLRRSTLREVPPMADQFTITLRAS